LDHLTTFRQYKNIKKDFNISISEADLILATASSIYTNLKITRDDVMLVPNAVALEDFEKTRIYSLSKKDNKILRKIYALKENSEVVVGYYGAIAEWIDFELIEYCAHKNPNWQFIFIGEMYPRIKAASKFNIHYFERVDYYTLPYILECFDISIVPFLLNEITHNTSPVKIFEYMAGGKPIVSTNLPEAMKYRSVLIAGDKIGFEKKLHEALQCKNDQNYRMQLNKDAHNNTWLKRVSHILEVLVERNLLN
ncbi:MAG TPA: glycosyltransferase, partial [Paenibacillus sp.]|uniref:glycosyltransferase n=1 Tax=Paenibacillus sp. TaxID=58172 RepID=UPI002CD09585